MKTKVTAVVLMLTMGAFVCSCGRINMLSATFDDSARAARGWAEACLDRDPVKAARFWSRGRQHPEDTVCAPILGVLDVGDSAAVVAVEDRGSMVSSGELLVFIRRSSDGKMGVLGVYLANSEDGPVVYDSVRRNGASPEQALYSASHFWY